MFRPTPRIQNESVLDVTPGRILQCVGTVVFFDWKNDVTIETDVYKLGTTFVVQLEDETYKVLLKDGEVAHYPEDHWYVVDDIEGLTSTVKSD